MQQRQIEETALRQGLAAGDRATFETVYRRHNAAMVRFATAIVRNRATAEEVAQEAWLAVLRHIAGFEGRSSLAGWIFTILTNKARSRAKADGRMVSFDQDGEDDSLAAAFDGRGRWKDIPDLWEEITPERIIAGRSILEHVNTAIDALPPAQRAVLILRGQQGLDATEVCAALEISDGNMRVLLHRARFALRSALDRLQA
ncbi:MAG: sigma-70 family RNA polymerase sigma factor [Rhodobacterales bacterium]|nr:sigma-70 family RNA polymerase sigma factor [Rhodobacterales bacterium]